jgi:hypothetical protein
LLIFLLAQQPPVGQGFVIIEASRSHSDTPHSVWLLPKSDQPVAETSTWQHTTLNKWRTSMPPLGFGPAIPASERLQTHVFARAATSIDVCFYTCMLINTPKPGATDICQPTLTYPKISWLLLH